MSCETISSQLCSYRESSDLTSSDQIKEDQQMRVTGTKLKIKLTGQRSKYQEEKSGLVLEFSTMGLEKKANNLV